jgi:phage-related protein
VAQYPLGVQQNFSTQVFRFLDGSEQRFPAYGATLKRWVIQLSLLDESELVNLEQFFLSEGGRSGTFPFTDPFDATVYASCSFDADKLDLNFGGFQGGATNLTIKENVS